VVLKPAADSPTIAAKFIDILFEAGVPKEAVNFITGPGSVIGDALVQHPKTRYIGFTGSKEVGCASASLLGRRCQGRCGSRRTVLEMGGKDGIGWTKKRTSTQRWKERRRRRLVIRDRSARLVRA